MRKKVLGAMFLLLIAGMLVSGCATPESEYDKTRRQIQGAVTDWMLEHVTLIPPHGEIINTSECVVNIGINPANELINAGYILDICHLFEYYADGSKDFTFELPICCYGQSGQEGTNFYTGNCTNPYRGHYVWVVDKVGNVCSVCVGDDCWAHNESGYQGVWP
jgi:hypothetical protein